MSPLQPTARPVRRVAVVGGVRIPFARSDGPYATASNQEMLTAALDGLVERFDLTGPGVVGEFVAGAVLKHSRDFNLARETVLGSRLDPRTPAYNIQQACGTELQAVIAAANKIALGQIDSAIAGGVDTTSDAPLAVNDDLRRILVQLNSAKTVGQRLKLLTKLRPGQIVPEIPRNAEPRTGLSMGEHAAVTARAWDIGRAAQDDLAATSHQRLVAAYDRGFFDDLVVPFRGLTRDQNLRPDSTVEKLARLKPVFGLDQPKPTMTAGNSTPLTDGASTVLLASEEWAKAHKLPVLAYLTFAETAAVDYVHGGEGLLMAPAYAMPVMLARNGLTLQDFDFYEIHEAFASVVLATLAAWESPDYCKGRLGLDAPLGAIDRSKLNVNGSSLAAGHPFAATGGRIVAQLAKLHYRTRGAVRMPVTIRVPYGGGIGAVEHHSESPEAYFAHTAGLRVVTCSDPQDAHTMIRQAIACDDPVLFFEPKRRYWTKGEVLDDLPADPLAFTRARTVRAGTDATLVAYGPLVQTALEAAEAAADEGVDLEVIDLRSLAPLDVDAVAASVPAALLALYERLASRGNGAGLLRAGACEACRMVIPPSDIATIRRAQTDDVVFCPECGAILVRTDESGLA